MKSRIVNIKGLKTCPFCGCEAKAIRHWSDNLKNLIKIECSEGNCYCKLNTYYSEYYAIKKWNRRQP